jgi:hypothetical protein
VRAPLLLLLLSACAAAGDVLNPTLRIEPRGGDLRLLVSGTSDLPRALADLSPLVHVEYQFVPRRVVRAGERRAAGLTLPVFRTEEGEPVSLGFHRARIATDAIEDNPALIETGPFTVAGQFAGLYRVRLVLEPARQRVRLRARGLPAASASAEAPWGNPARFGAQRRQARLEIGDDAATAFRLSRDLQALWEESLAEPRADARWTEALAGWRARIEPLPARNERRPGHAILDFMPAAKGALGEGFSALAALAAACERAMTLPPKDRASAVEWEMRRAQLAMIAVERAAGRPAGAPDAEAAAAAIEEMRAAPASLREWYGRWQTKAPGHGAAAWPAFERAFVERFVEALFTAGRAIPPDAYLDLAAAARAVLAEGPSTPQRNRSLLSAYSSRILGETSSLDGAAVSAGEAELAERLGRVGKALERR